MAWIDIIKEGSAEAGPLADLHARSVDPVSGRVDDILRVHSLHPEGWSAHLALYGAVMGGTPGLRKVERELIALVVSRQNGCHY
ncbi:MAG: alkylhydroperoxidase family enzyme [Chlamydiales bacterium]|jgi:alkylhydroperoxidase family enzyme